VNKGEGGVSGEMTCGPGAEPAEESVREGGGKIELVQPGRRKASKGTNI